MSGTNKKIYVGVPKAGSDDYHDFTRLTTEPSNPPLGCVRMWLDASGILKVKNDAGVVKEVQFVNL